MNSGCKHKVKCLLSILMDTIRCNWLQSKVKPPTFHFQNTKQRNQFLFFPLYQKILFSNKGRGCCFYSVWSSESGGEVTEVTPRGIYGLWIWTIVMLIWSNASDDPQSRIKFHEPAAQLHWIHTSPCDKATEWARGLPKNCIWDSLLVKVLAQLSCVLGVWGL